MAKKTISAETTRFGYRDCHDDVVKVMTIGNAAIYAGRYIDVLLEPNLDLRIRFDDPYFASARAEGGLVTANKAAMKILPPELISVPEIPSIVVKWPDYEAPDLDPIWWERLVSWFLVQETPIKVGIGCTGGHGRTGTALAILAELSGVCKNDDPVLWVRKQYCEFAVESGTQLDYIEDVTGIYTEARPTGWTHHGVTSGVVTAAGVGVNSKVTNEKISQWDTATAADDAVNAEDV